MKAASINPPAAAASAHTVQPGDRVRFRHYLTRDERQGQVVRLYPHHNAVAVAVEEDGARREIVVHVSNLVTGGDR